MFDGLSEEHRDSYTLPCFDCDLTLLYDYPVPVTSLSLIHLTTFLTAPRSGSCCWHLCIVFWWLIWSVVSSGWASPVSPGSWYWTVSVPIRWCSAEGLRDHCICRHMAKMLVQTLLCAAKCGQRILRRVQQNMLALYWVSWQMGLQYDFIFCIQMIIN